MAREQKPATRNAAVVDQILAAGATITGKTICDEFFYSIAGVNAHYGTPTIYAPGRIPGGSSSGSAAACGANACDFAVGSDTGGSFASQPPSMGFTACAPPMAALTLLARWRWLHRSMRAVGLPMRRASFSASGRYYCADPPSSASEAFGACARCLRSIRCRGRGPWPRVPQTNDSVLPQASEVTAAPGGFDEWREAFRIVQAKEVWETFGAIHHPGETKARTGHQGAHGIRSDDYGRPGRCCAKNCRPRRARISARWCHPAR